LALFLADAAVIAFLGGAGGIVLALSVAKAMTLFAVALPVKISWFFVGLAEVVSVLIGLVAGVLPARAAAKLEPVQALRAE
jgi:putative ABC transport system permease protein